MTKKKSFISLMLAFCMIITAMFTLTACTSHTYSEDWSVDAEYHWHACTDENCSATKDKEKHSFDADDKCTICQKIKFTLKIDIGDKPISADTGMFQSYWIVECPDAEYLDVNSYYTIEYFKYGADGTTLTSVGEDFPSNDGRYQVKVTFDGDKIYLPAQAIADFEIE